MKSAVLGAARVYNARSSFIRAVKMKRSRTEVGRWRMLRQASRRKSRWLEGQSRRNMRIHSIRKCLLNQHRNILLFAIYDL
jgi:hypothetical protein